MSDQYAIITGASRGIGREIAVQISKRGFNVLLIARSGDLLEKIADDIKQKHHVDAQFLALDLLRAKSIAELIDWIDSLNVEVSVLINNAGYGLWGRFAQISIHDQLRMMQLNMLCLVELTHQLIPLLTRRTCTTHIMNIASTAAYQPIPGFSVYAASKAFVMSFSRGLSYELRNSNIKVTYLSPGATTTNFMDRAGMEPMKKMADKFSMMPNKVAKIGIKGMLKGKKEVIPGVMNYIFSRLAALLPTALTSKIAASIYEKHL